MNVKKLMAMAIIGTMCISGVACTQTPVTESSVAESSIAESESAEVDVQPDSWYKATNIEITSIEFTDAEFIETRDGDLLPTVANDTDVHFVLTSPDLISSGIVNNITIQWVSFDEEGVATTMDALDASNYNVEVDEATNTLTITFNDGVVEEGETKAFTICGVGEINPELMYADKGFIAIVIVGDTSAISFNDDNTANASVATEETTEITEASETSTDESADESTDESTEETVEETTEETEEEA